MAGRRINLAELADDPPLTEARVPAFTSAAAQTIRIAQVAINPLNTREVGAQRAKVASLAESIRQHGQLQPCTVVSRTAFLAIFPEYGPSIESAAFVQVTGGRRRAAALEAGLQTIEVTVKDALAGSRAQFVAATAAENLDRQDLDPIEEAHAVRLLVGECGTGKAAAEQLSRTPAWVTQRLNLLKLEPELQSALQAGEIPLREVRDLHTVDPDRQRAALDTWRRAQAARQQLTAVNPGEDDPQEGSDSPPKADKTVAAARRAHATAAAIRRLGETPIKIAESLRSALPPDDVKALAKELLRVL